MSVHVSLSDLVLAFDWVSAAGPFENAAYVSRESGRIYWETETGDFEEDLPEDVHDASLYARVPHQHDLDLGQALVFRFVEANAPDSYDKVRGYFSKRGAYARFKRLLEDGGLLEAWYAYEQQASEAALREWAESEGLQIVEGESPHGQ